MVSPVNQFASDDALPSGVANLLSASPESGSAGAPILAITSVWANEGSNVGEVANGGSTDDRMVNLEGTGVPGTLIILVHNGINLGASVGADGRWQYELRLQPGQNEVVARSISETTQPYFIEYAPPVAPLPQVVSVWTDEGLVGEVGNGGTTDDRTVQVQGYGTPSTFIWLLVNGQPVDLGFSIDGKWQKELTLEEGRNEIIVWSSKGNSEPFIIDYVPAVVEPILPAIGSVSGVEGQGDIGNGESTGEYLVLIRGTGAPGTQFYLWGVGGGWTSVEVGSDGTWQIYSLLDPGRNEFKVEYDGQISESFIVDYVVASVSQAPISFSEDQADALVGPSVETPAFDALFSAPQTQLFVDDAAGPTSTAAPLIIGDIDLLGTTGPGQGLQVLGGPSIQWPSVDEAQLQAFH